MVGLGRWLVQVLVLFGAVGRVAAEPVVPLGPEIEASSFAAEPTAAVNAAGELVVVSGSTARRYAPDGTLLGSIPSFISGSAARTEIAGDVGGDMVAVWRTLVNGFNLVGVRRLNTYTTGSQRSQKVLRLPGGEILVVWESPAEGTHGPGIYGQRYTSTGQPLGSEFPVHQTPENSASGPYLAGNAAGHGVVVPQRHGGAGRPPARQRWTAERRRGDARCQCQVSVGPGHGRRGELRRDVARRRRWRPARHLRTALRQFRRGAGPSLPGERVHDRPAGPSQGRRDGSGRVRRDLVGLRAIVSRVRAVLPARHDDDDGSDGDHHDPRRRVSRRRDFSSVQCRLRRLREDVEKRTFRAATRTFLLKRLRSAETKTQSAAAVRTRRRGRRARALLNVVRRNLAKLLARVESKRGMRDIPADLRQSLLVDGRRLRDDARGVLTP